MGKRTVLAFISILPEHSGRKKQDSDKGPNGMILDLENKLLICQHGDRRIADGC